MVPMTKEEHEKQKSKVRRVFDPETGRNRYFYMISLHFRGRILNGRSNEFFYFNIKEYKLRVLIFKGLNHTHVIENVKQELLVEDLWVIAMSFRLVRGDGEIIEEVVSYQRHKEINKVKCWKKMQWKYSCTTNYYL